MKKLESLKQAKFKQLSKKQQSELFGGQVTTMSMPTYYTGGEVTDTATTEDSHGPVWT